MNLISVNLKRIVINWIELIKFDFIIKYVCLKFADQTKHKKKKKRNIDFLKNKDKTKKVEHKVKLDKTMLIMMIMSVFMK